MSAPELPTDILHSDSKSPELTSWDFLQDVDFGLETELGGSSLPQDCATGTVSKSERQKEKNRIAQKRFRDRKKERAQTTEAHLAQTTSQLHDLRLKQRELEARNSLLEKIAALNKQHSFSGSSSVSARTQDDSITDRQADERRFFLQVLEQAGLRRTQQGSAILLTARDCEEEVTIAYLASLPQDELLQLKTAYTQKMAQCLLDISNNSQSTLLVDLQRYSLELAAAFVCFWMSNAHRAVVAFIESLSINSCGQGASPDSQCEDLLVAMKLTEGQEQDLLHLRRLFYGKLGQLSRERAALLKKMPSPAQPNEAVSFHCDFQHVADQLSLAEEVSGQLCANHAEESSVYRMHGFCMFRCIYSTVQHATVMVYSHPRPVDPNKLLEMVASKHNEQSIEALLSPSGIDDLQHSANWETVKKYISTLSPSNVHDHCPFLQKDGVSKS